MRILFVTPYLPSPIRARSYNFILELGRRGHKITLISLRGKKEEPSEELKNACEQIITVAAGKFGSILRSGRALLSGESMWVASCKSEAMKAAVAVESDRVNYDILHVEHIRAISFLNGAKARVKVLDAVDCMEPLLKRIAAHKRNPLVKHLLNIESRRIGIRESAISRIFDRVVITSEHERELLLKQDQSAEIDVVPIGVDLNKFCPSYDSRDPFKLIFTGKMSYFPNADGVSWFVSSVYPELAGKHKVSLTIAGAEPGPDVLELANVPGVEVTGFVPELQPLLQRAGIAVCPLRIAAGAQFKVIEAMACGLPVVASPLAARTMSDCRSLVTAESESEWVSGISGLLDDPSKAMALGTENRSYVEKHFSWSNSVDRLEKSYDAALSSADKVRTIV